MKKFWLCFAVVACAVLAVYAFSFQHLFRGETYIYFLNTQGHDTLNSLVSNFYNYEKVRIYEPGDTLLFRPLLFTIIGAEKAFFGSNYILWHAFAVIVHLVATFCLFRLLWKWRKGWIAVLVSVFFGTSYMIVNTVLYEQVVPYMVFTALVLTAIYYLDTKPVVSFVCMAVGSFAYEMALPFVLLMGVYYWYKKEKKSAVLIASVIPVYLAFYLPEKLIAPNPMVSGDAGSLFSWAGITSGLSSVIPLGRTWVDDIVFPSKFTLRAVSELNYAPAQIVDVPFSVIFIILFILNLLALVVLIAPLMGYLIDVLWKKKSVGELPAIGKAGEAPLARSYQSVQSYLTQPPRFITSVPPRLAASPTPITPIAPSGYYGTPYAAIPSGLTPRRELFPALLLGLIIVAVLSISLFRSGTHGANYTINHSFGLYTILALSLALCFYMIKDRPKNDVVALGLIVFIGLSAPKTFVWNQQVLKLDESAYSRNVTINTYTGSPSNPVWVKTSIPEIMAGVK